MFCTNCGKPLNQEDKFCTNCGTMVEVLQEQILEDDSQQLSLQEKEVLPTQNNTALVKTTLPQTNEVPTQIITLSPTPSRLNVFGIIAFPFSILSLILCWFPVYNLMFSTIALTLSIVGTCKKRTFSRKAGLCKSALVLSIIGTCLSIILFFCFFLLILTDTGSQTDPTLIRFFANI